LGWLFALYSMDLWKCTKNYTTLQVRFCNIIAHVILILHSSMKATSFTVTFYKLKHFVLYIALQERSNDWKHMKSILSGNYCSLTSVWVFFVFFIDYNNTFRSLYVIFKRFMGFSFIITLRQKPKGILKRQLLVFYLYCY